MSFITEMFSFAFMTRTVIAGALISLCAALLGVPLVLRRLSMIGDGLSHVGFGALALGSVLGIAPLYVAIPVVIAAAFLLLRIKNRSGGDAAIAMISIFALAVGMTAMSLKTGSTAGVSAYMFGSILAVTRTDVLLCAFLTAAVLILGFVCYKQTFAAAFDEGFSRACCAGVNMLNSVSAVLTALTVVLGMRLMGSLLISCLVIFPPLSAMRVTGSFRSVTAVSCVLSLVCFIVGISVSYVLGVPAGAAVAITNAAAFAVCFFAGKLKRN